MLSEGTAAPPCNERILAQIETPVTFLWYGVVAGGGHSYPPPAFTGRDGCHTRPASLQPLVIFVQERIFVQRRWRGFAPRAVLHKRCAENLTNYLPCCYRSALRCEGVATSPSGYAGRERITSPSQQALSLPTILSLRAGASPSRRMLL